jgi:hypothetical protein
MSCATLFAEWSKRSRLALLFCIFLLPLDAWGQYASPITRVEEDWEMDVIAASEDLTAPQIVMQMSVDGATNDYFTFEINHSSQPEFSHGGIQVQAWDDDESYNFKNSPTSRTLERYTETIRWTQDLSVQDGWARFEIEDFKSISIGSFNNESLLTIYMPTGAQDLSGYSPNYSQQLSSVPYAENRVSSLKLLRVRYFSGSSLVGSTELNLPVIGD